MNSKDITIEDLDTSIKLTVKNLKQRLYVIYYKNNVEASVRGVIITSPDKNKHNAVISDIPYQKNNKYYYVLNPNSQNRHGFNHIYAITERELSQPHNWWIVPRLTNLYSIIEKPKTRFSILK